MSRRTADALLGALFLVSVGIAACLLIDRWAVCPEFDRVCLVTGVPS